MAISSGTQLRPIMRIISFILVEFAILAVYRSFQLSTVPSWAWWLIGAMLIPWCALFGYAAITGRAPRWFVYTDSKK
jgi:hypothetical protein